MAGCKGRVCLLEHLSVVRQRESEMGGEETECGGRVPRTKISYGSLGEETHSAEKTSPPLRVTSAANVRMSMLSRMNRTEPSHISAFVPLVWKL